VGALEKKVNSAKELAKFYDDCMINRSTGSTKLNDRSSRSHAIFTINIHRTTVEVRAHASEHACHVRIHCAVIPLRMSWL